MFDSQICLALVFIIPIALCGCENDAKYNKELNTSSKPTFRPPLDGKLTEKQVTDYIVIRQRIIRDVETQKSAKKIAQAETKEDLFPDPNFRYFDEIEKSVANSFNMSYDEFLWIKDTVISTRTTLLVQRYYSLNHKIMTLLDETLVRFKEINNEKLEQHEQFKMDGYVDEMKQEMTNLREKMIKPTERSGALEHNSILVSKFIKELEFLEQ